MDNIRLAHKNARKGKKHYSEVNMVDNNSEYYFKQVYVDCGVLTWQGEVDIAPETVYSMATGKPLPEWMEV